jgi:aryl-alcohol dehydrogenase-like predicted oxidoreductase
VESDAPQRLISYALDQGINFFDTAPLYGPKEENGRAEKILGRTLGKHRSTVLISTKFGRTACRVTPGRFTADEARKSCEASLRRMGRDTIDVFFFHSPFNPGEINDDVWESLATLQQEGKIRYIGHSVSMFNETSAMSAEWMRERRIDVVQVVLSLFNREARSLIDTAITCDCGVIARECLANGFLSGTITKDSVFPEGTLNSRYSREEIADRAGYADSLSEVLVSGPVRTLPQAAYRWILDQSGISLALSGAKEPDELQDIAMVSGLPEFDPEKRNVIEVLHRQDFGAA